MRAPDDHRNPKPFTEIRLRMAARSPCTQQGAGVGGPVTNSASLSCAGNLVYIFCGVLDAWLSSCGIWISVFWGGRVDIGLPLRTAERMAMLLGMGHFWWLIWPSSIEISTILWVCRAPDLLDTSFKHVRLHLFHIILCCTSLLEGVATVSSPQPRLPILR